MDAQQLIDVGLKGIIGFGGIVAGFVGGWSALYWRTRGMRADYEDLKRKRRLTNAKAAEHAELMSKHVDAFVKLKAANASPEEFRSYVEETSGRKRKRTAKALTMAADEGHFVVTSGPVEFVTQSGAPANAEIQETEDGEKVRVWKDAATGEIEMETVPRTPAEIAEAEAEFFDKVWYNRHHIMLEKVEAGEDTIAPDVLKNAQEAAKRVEARVDLSEWPWDDFEWGMINGKLSALRWVQGEAWDFLDT